MGNYKNIEQEFIERTLAIIAQYESQLHRYEFEQQYNYTLLINCLLGLIVMPKERTISYLPNARLTKKIKISMGLEDSIVNPDIKTVKDLIIALRHSLAHFDIKVVSNDHEFLVDEIVFCDNEKEDNYEVVRFKSTELQPFIRYYSNWLIKNLEANSK